MSINLTTAVTTSPDLGAYRFYVEPGARFDPSDYAEAYGLTLGELDGESIKSARTAASQLMAGEWLEVSHEISE